MVTIHWDRRPRLARRPAGAVRPARARPGHHGPALRPGDLRGAEGLPAAPTARSPPSVRRQNARRFQRSAAPARDARAARGALPRRRSRRSSPGRRPGCPTTPRGRSTCGRSCSPPRSASACARPSSTCTCSSPRPPARTSRAGVKPVSVWLSEDYVRAAPGGTGEAKCAGNYAASLVAQAQAAEQGCDQVVWLDAVERRWVEEMGGMNLYFVYGSGDDARIVTPALTGSLLPGRHPRLAAHAGRRPRLRRRGGPHLHRRCGGTATRSGEITEVFACGTAAVITPVGEVKAADGRGRSATARPAR